MVSNTKKTAKRTRFILEKLTYIFGLAALIAIGFVVLNLAKNAQPNNNLAESETYYSSSNAFTNQAILPIPLSISLNPDKVALGKQLFHDTLFSGDNSISCASCHSLDTAGTTRAARATGIHNQQSKRNAPTVFNSAYNFAQLWDGQFDSLEQQISGPIHNSLEMASDWKTILAKLKQEPLYIEAFSRLYAGALTEASVKDAIATFEKSLITPNSRFDQYLRGDNSALSAKEKDGYQLFTSLGCVSCHQGINIGGNLFQKIGLFKEYQSVDLSADIDLGRFEITGNEDDKHVFKVPSLRNVAKTPPYFHDGSVATLEEAIELMADYQLGREITEIEVANISAFLKTLTGSYNGKPL